MFARTSNTIFLSREAVKSSSGLFPLSTKAHAAPFSSNGSLDGLVAKGRARPEHTVSSNSCFIDAVATNLGVSPSSPLILCWSLSPISGANQISINTHAILAPPLVTRWPERRAVQGCPSGTPTRCGEVLSIARAGHAFCPAVWLFCTRGRNPILSDYIRIPCNRVATCRSSVWRARLLSPCADGGEDEQRGNCNI